MRALLWTLCGVLWWSGCYRDSKQKRIWPTPETSSTTAVSETNTDKGSPAEPADTRTFDPSVATPELVVKEVRQAVEDNHMSRAIELASAAIPNAKVGTKARLHWLSARAHDAKDESQAARAHWHAVTALRHPLSKWATLYEAATLEWSDPTEAAKLAETISRGWTGAWRARLLEARALALSDQTAEAKPKLEQLLTEASPGRPAPSIAIPLAKIYEKDGDLDAARRTYARVARLGKGSDAAEQARKQLAKLGGTATPRQRASATGRLIAEADRQYYRKKYRSAERTYLRAAKALQRGSDTWCHAMDRRAQAMLHRKERTRGAPAMAYVAEQCAEPEARVWARYRAARAFGRLGRWTDAIGQYESLQTEHPSHRLADDAAYRVALAELERGRQAEYERKLAALPERYPDGDMWELSLFRLAWDKMREDDPQRAFELFDELLRRNPTEPDEGMAGRAAYWRARMLQALERNDDAIAGYVDIAKKWPLRYYAQLALQRLTELDEAQAATLVKEMHDQDDDREFVFAWRDEFANEEFARAAELLAVGETTLATLEMKRLGMVGEHLDAEMAVVGAVLLRRSGSKQKLSRVIRNHFQAFEGLLPVGEGRLLWEAAYPLAYAPLVEQSAKKEKVPAPFVRAIAREESSFDPTAVSWARAYGLVQLLVPTAKRFSKGLGVQVSPATLKNPKINLRIGARYMSWLQKRLKDHTALVPAAYNAGENAVRRWLQETDATALDVFVEEIPYDETRRYTRRVLQSYGVYAWLSESTLPKFREQLPSGER